MKSDNLFLSVVGLLLAATSGALFLMHGGFLFTFSTFLGFALLVVGLHGFARGCR